MSKNAKQVTGQVTGRRKMRSNFRGTFLSRALHDRFVEYLKAGRRKVPPVTALNDLLPTFAVGAKCDRRAVQGKFKSWARRMWLSGGDTLMLGSKVIVSREKFVAIAWSLHSANPAQHLCAHEVALKVQSLYTWGQKNFGMSWEIVCLACELCTRPECQNVTPASAARHGDGSRCKGENEGSTSDLTKCPPRWLTKSMKVLKTSISSVGHPDSEGRSSTKDIHKNETDESSGQDSGICSLAVVTSPSQKQAKTEGDAGSCTNPFAESESSRSTLSPFLIAHMANPEASQQLTQILIEFGKYTDVYDEFTAEQSYTENAAPCLVNNQIQPGQSDDASSQEIFSGGSSGFLKLLQDIDELRMFFPLRGNPSHGRCIECLLNEVSRLRTQVKGFEQDDRNGSTSSKQPQP
ncbi:uncharacterized protein LOC135378042 isoform X2 [Ornithodoros turicata]|uniref:uncharacterized protein LOC135378042 isoform X2 n=1 Tax=Ornithodoros turicata TaxID=34597 RepID=UPI0031398679